MLAAIVNVDRLVGDFGYPLLFLLVMAESGGVPIPGETALITSGVLASQGKLQIGVVIAVAATAAIVGDNIGYVIGRKGGRWLLQRPGAFHRQRQEVLRVGEPFFQTHGPKAVFLGRFILGLRVWASWLAGATRMPWRSFVVWNALGGITWATVIGLIAYFLGNSAGNAIQAFGLYGLAAVLIAIVGGFVMRRRHVRSQPRPPTDAHDTGEPDTDSTSTSDSASDAGNDRAAQPRSDSDSGRAVRDPVNGRKPPGA